MPLFEYVCHDCQHRFETLVTASRQPACPFCQGERLEKQLSVFAVSAKDASASSSAADPIGACGTCGDPRGPGSCRIN
jgi:putative FmdB family regulatory protein